MIGCSDNLGGINKSDMVSLQVVTERNYAIWWRNMFRSTFQRVWTATEKARIRACVLNLVTDSKWKPDERSTLGLGATESTEDRRKGFIDTHTHILGSQYIYIYLSFVSHPIIHQYCTPELKTFTHSPKYTQTN